MIYKLQWLPFIGLPFAIHLVRGQQYWTSAIYKFPFLYAVYITAQALSIVYYTPGVAIKW